MRLCVLHCHITEKCSDISFIRYWVIVRRKSAESANSLYFEMALNNPYLLSVSLDEETVITVGCGKIGGICIYRV